MMGMTKRLAETKKKCTGFGVEALNRNESAEIRGRSLKISSLV